MLTLYRPHAFRCCNLCHQLLRVPPLQIIPCRRQFPSKHDSTGPVPGRYRPAGINGIGPIHALHSGCESGQCWHTVLGQCWPSAGLVLGQCWRKVPAQYWPSTGMRYWPSAGPVLVQHWASTGAMYWPSTGPVPACGIGPVLGQCWSSIGPVLAQCIGPVPV